MVRKDHRITPEDAYEAVMERSSWPKKHRIAVSVCNRPLWKDEAHYMRFRKALKCIGSPGKQCSRACYAALFLLTAVDTLSGRVQDCFSREGIDFSRARLGGISLDDYELYKAAKCFYTGSGEVGADELADPGLYHAETFCLVLQSMLICRYGV